MKRKILILPCLILIVICVVVSTGCISGTKSSTSNPAQTVAPSAGANIATTPATTTPIVLVTAVTPQPSASTLSSYTNNPYGISLSYPSEWSYNEPGTWGVRDYGRNTLNIVNFYAPGTSNYTLSIDTDPGYSGNLEDYFNKAVVALQNTYTQENLAWDETGASYQMQISGNKAYRIDYVLEKYGYSKPIATGVQFYTIVNGNVYIFTYVGVSNDESLAMVKSITLNPTSPVTTMSRI
ncbi:MAG: hypothetical protein ABSG28_09835 [Methanoregula sp.]|uniref:hypothetical protein n=1 Tax=Methanoregula sp. TaxID=2052170 RepID=UPI003C227B79